MTQSFDKAFWESHWGQADAGREIAPNPYLARETGALVPGTALDAGCGEGAEALWLAAAGWNVTAADISSAALYRAAERAGRSEGLPGHVAWVEADLGSWEPDAQFDLVTTHYAHPAMPQLAFYQRLSDWVAPGGTLLIVGHLHGSSHGDAAGTHQHRPPADASATAAGVTAVLDRTRWEIVTADEPRRTLGGGTVELNDVVVRARRRS